MYSNEEIKYLKLLSKKFPTVQAVCTEIINKVVYIKFIMVTC